MSSNQQKKIKFLEAQGGVVVDLEFTVVKKPDGSKALIDEFGRVEWISGKDSEMLSTAWSVIQEAGYEGHSLELKEYMEGRS